MSATIVYDKKEGRKNFCQQMANAAKYNSFVLNGKKYEGDWKNNTSEMYRQIMKALAEFDFEKLFQNRGTRGSPGIITWEERKKYNEKYYDDAPFFTTKDEKTGEESKYFLFTHYNANQLMSKLWTCVGKMGVQLEVTYEPGSAVKQEENDDGTTSIGEEQISSRTEIQLSDLIETGGKRQIILTGAPGTGKTYTAKMIAKGFIEQGNDFYAYYRSIGAKLADRKVRDAVTRLLSDTSFRAGAWGEAGALQAAYPAFEEAYVKGVCEQIGMEDYGPAEFWKEAERLRGRLAFVQFHPSYDYTDFVEGLRPVDQGGKMQFKRMDGSFMSFCRFVAWQNSRIEDNLDNLYFFIIDEINRADLSKVLGELMFCLEEDKRGKENGVFTQYHNNLDTYFPDLDGKQAEEEQKAYRECFRGGFFIPENVVVIGTMNDIDRSVTGMDFALRRRFVWEEVEVTEELLNAAFSGNDRFGVLHEREAVRSQVIARILRFNQTMHGAAEHLGKDYDISQGQFINLSEDELDLSAEELKDDKKTADAVMDWVWTYRLRSLMKEYLRGETGAEAILRDLEKAWLQEETQ